MNIEKDSVVQFHYSLSDANGPIESSVGNDPLTILVGHGQLIPGMENALVGRAAGDKFAVYLHRTSKDLPFAAGVEVVWRFSRPHWGQGYAPEAARAAMADGVTRLGAGRPQHRR